MHKIINYLLLTFVLFTSKIYGQSTSQHHLIDTIPFTLTEFNNISIRAILNQTDTVGLMFHTAVGGVSLIKSSIKNLKSLQLDQDETITTWGGKVSTQSSNNNSLQIGNFHWDSLSITASEHSGRLTDGKFGPHLFKGKIIELDFDKSILLLHTTLPQIGEEYQKRTLIFNRGFMFLEGNLNIGNDSYSNNFLIHSGFGGTMLLDDEFVKKYKIGSKLEIISESELKDSYGNILKTQKAILPSLDFGHTKFTDVRIGFFEGAIARQKMSVLGGELLKRFNMIIDIQNEHIYLKPNSLFHVAFVE